MSTLKATYLQQASSASPNITLDASTNATVAGTLAMGSSFKRNRFINGNMVVDQRNSGASVTITNTGATTYTLDRWFAYGSVASKFSVQQNAGSVTPPTGFSYYLGCTSASAYSVGASDVFLIAQSIEGFNTADFMWGTANAKTVTLSFQVYSSLTGTFGGALKNSANNRTYPFSYTISSANTWTSISVTIAGDTTGTWVGATNGVGLQVVFSLGSGSSASGTAGSWTTTNYTSVTGATSVVGTNGATFYITGVQLEVGSVATPYERQIYSDQLAQCQRYCCTSFPPGTAPAQNAGTTGSPVSIQGFSASAGNQGINSVFFPVIMRASATITGYNPSAANAQFRNLTRGQDCSSTALYGAHNQMTATFTTSSSSAVGDTNSIHYLATAEL